MEWKNWSGRLSSSPTKILQPRDEAGVIEAGIEPRKPDRVTPEFVSVSVREPVRSVSGTALRVRLSSGALLEWSEAPQGEVLRELIGMLS